MEYIELDLDTIRSLFLNLTEDKKQLILSCCNSKTAIKMLIERYNVYKMSSDNNKVYLSDKGCNSFESISLHAIQTLKDNIIYVTFQH